MTRVLVPSPPTFVDAGGALAFGSFAGPLPAVIGSGLGIRDRIARRKKWVYVAIAANDVWIALGVVRTGYAATAFAYAYDLEAKRMLAEETVLTPWFSSLVADDPNARGVLASFRAIGRRVVVERDKNVMSIHADLGKVRVAATLDAKGSPPPISAIGSLGDGLWDATEKRALSDVKGSATIDGRHLSLDGAVGGWDYTHGLMPRHTKWRWAFALGSDEDGAAIGWNLVSGFIGEAECAAFDASGTHPLAEPRFEFDAARPGEPWRLTGDGIDLAFSPGAVHAQYNNLGIVRSRFVQPVGTFSGTLRVDGRERRLACVPGVVEDQDVLW